MKYLNIYIFALGLLSLTACSESFLDSKSITSLTDVDFYKTTADANKALIGCYDGLQRVWTHPTATTIALPVLAEVCSDNAFGGTGNGDGFSYQLLDEFDKSRSTATVDLFDGNWISYYAGVYRCNMLIGKLDQIDWKGDTQARLNTEAEARFLRAYMYFDMTRLWGSIPLIMVPTADNVPASSPDSIYKAITSDLKFAAANMNSVPYTTTWATANDGRVTKWAAKSLLARVYLYYTGYYGKTDLPGATKAEVLTGLESVISASGYGLLPNYANLWPAASLTNYAGEGNQETIFAIKYNYTNTNSGNQDGNNWMVMLGLREQTTYPYSKGWGACTINPKLWNAFSDNDTRKAASIISFTNENIAIGAASIASQREFTGYIGKKYTPLSNEAGEDLAEALGAVSFQTGQYEDYVSIRYADVLLMAAELGSANAQDYFDQVRKRAYKSNFTSLAVSKANILNERRLEFSGEGIRYWDLLRQGVDVAASIVDETATVKNGGLSVTKTIKGDRLKITKGLQQIPNTQITLSNKVLVQNPGW